MLGEVNIQIIINVMNLDSQIVNICMIRVMMMKIQIIVITMNIWMIIMCKTQKDHCHVMIVLKIWMISNHFDQLSFHIIISYNQSIADIFLVIFFR